MVTIDIFIQHHFIILTSAVRLGRDNFENQIQECQ